MFTNVHQCFLLNIIYFSVCLTSNKLYWIEDQLADVSTRFYTSASWTVGKLTVIPLKALWNRKSITLERRLKWHASGSVLFNYFKMTWTKLKNTKTLLIRGSKHDTFGGRPDELFFLPELHRGVDGLLHLILDDEIQSMRENQTYEEEESIYQEFFEYVLEKSCSCPTVLQRDSLSIKNSLKLLT